MEIDNISKGLRSCSENLPSYRSSTSSSELTDVKPILERSHRLSDLLQVGSIYLSLSLYVYISPSL